MLPNSWKPVAAINLQRVGPNEDGGYVVSSSAVKESRVLLSMGLNHDWRFEEDFQKASGAKVICYDGSVDRRFWQMYAVKKVLRLKPFQVLHYLGYRKFFGSGQAEHRLMMIGYDGPKSVSLSTTLKEIKSDKIFLKVDIEGWEYRIFDEIVMHQDRFIGIVMELHDIDLHRDRISKFIESMNNFKVINLTPNNFAGVDSRGDPIVVEVSMICDRFVESPSDSMPPQTIPYIKNTIDLPSITIKFESSVV